MNAVAELDREADTAPLEWCEVSVADVVAMLPGFAFKSENFVTETDEGLPLIRIRDLGQTATAARYVGEYDETFAVQDGDILVGMDGEFSAVRWCGGKALLNQRVLKLSTAQPDLIDEGYLFYRAQPALLELEQTISGTTVKHLSTKDLKRLVWQLPPLDEQRRIAEVLRSVDEAIAANELAIEQVQLTRDAIRDEHFRASGTEGQARALGSVCEITKLAGFEYSKHIQYGESDEIIAIRGLNIKDGRLLLDDIKTISRATSRALPRSALRRGDLVMSYVGTIGEVAKVDADDCYHLAPNVALLRCGEQALPDYVLHFLYSRSGREQIGKYVSTSSQQSLSMGKIRSFEIALPSIDDQRHITDTMDTINASLTKGLETQSQLLSQKAHLLDDLLAGRVRVPA